MPIEPPEDSPADSPPEPVAERPLHVLFLRRNGQVSGPFPRPLLQHYRLLGRIAESDELSEDRQLWGSVRDVLGASRALPAAQAGEPTEGRNWDEERHQARLRWIDERSGLDRRQQGSDEPKTPSARVGGDRREGWMPGQGGAGRTEPPPESPRSRHAHLTVAVLLAVVVGIGVALWLFVPRLVPHVTLVR